MKKKIISTLIFSILVLIGLIYISNYDYLLNAVSKIYFTGHTTAYIDDFKQFDNNILSPSKNPQVWPNHEKYNSITLPKALEAHHKKTQTTAFVIIKNDSIYFEK